MKFFCNILLFLTSVNVFAQTDTNSVKEHSIGIKYNLTMGNIIASETFHYDKSLFYNFVPLEFTYSNHVPTERVSVHFSLMFGQYKDKDYNNRQARMLRHQMTYGGVKFGVGVRKTSKSKGYMQYSLAFFYASETMRIDVPDANHWTYFSDTVRIKSAYVIGDIGYYTYAPLNKSERSKFLWGCGININPFLVHNRFATNVNNVKRTASPVIGAMPLFFSLFSPYVSVGFMFK